MLEFTCPSGIADELGGCCSLRLSGFCKESLYLAQEAQSGRVVAFGRYGREGTWEPGEMPRVEQLVSMAWHNYKAYEGRGYNIPFELQSLFLRYGYLVEKTEVKLVAAR